MNRAMTWSIGIHVGVVLFFLLVPRDWISTPPKRTMTISLGGTPGPRSTGTTSIGGRTVEQVTPPPKRPEVVKPTPKNEPDPVAVKPPPPQTAKPARGAKPEVPRRVARRRADQAAGGLAGADHGVGARRGGVGRAVHRHDRDRVRSARRRRGRATPRRLPPDRDAHPRHQRDGARRVDRLDVPVRQPRPVAALRATPARHAAPRGNRPGRDRLHPVLQRDPAAPRRRAHPGCDDGMGGDPVVPPRPARPRTHRSKPPPLRSRLPSLLESDVDVAIDAQQLQRDFGETHAVDGRRPGHRHGRDLRLPRPQRRRQVDDCVRMLCTLLLADRRDRAIVAGYDVVDDADEVRLRIGVALQDAALDDKQTGIELLRLQGAPLRPVPRRRSSERIDELADDDRHRRRARRAASARTRGA